MVEADDDAPVLRRFSYFGIAYLALTTMTAVAAVLLIWPESGQLTWLRGMSDEIRFVAISAIGGVIGFTLRVTAILGGVGAKPLPRSGRLDLIVRFLIAIQLAALAYLMIRSFVVLPTTPVSALSPFGVLALGLFTGVLAEDLISSLAARLLEPGNAKLASQLDRIADAVGATSLDNYQGRICVQVLHGGEFLTENGQTSEPKWLHLQPNRKYTLLAWFQPGSRNGGRSEAISISGGNDVPLVTFVVTPDSSAAIGFDPGRHVCSFDPKKKSDRVAFEFVAPVTEGLFTIWIRVTQKDRLASVLALQAMAMDPE